MNRKVLAAVILAALAAVAQARELTWSYVVPAAANKAGLLGTDWHTDLTIFNPHSYNVPIVMQYLETGRDNSYGAPTIEAVVLPLETLNYWDVLGVNGFNARGTTGAVLVSGDDTKISCQTHACDISVLARTYTLNPTGGSGEFGQAVPGFPTDLSLDATVLAFMPQITVDQDFRTNLGVVSLTNAQVTVRFELQATNGAVINRSDHVLAPFGHSQWPLPTGVTGGTVAAFILAGPSGATVVPYASVINNASGDAIHIEADITAVGVSIQTAGVRRPISFPARLLVPGFVIERGPRLAPR